MRRFKIEFHADTLGPLPTAACHPGHGPKVIDLDTGLEVEGPYRICVEIPTHGVVFARVYVGRDELEFEEATLEINLRCLTPAAKAPAPSRFAALARRWAALMDRLIPGTAKG